MAIVIPKIYIYIYIVTSIKISKEVQEKHTDALTNHMRRGKQPNENKQLENIRRKEGAALVLLLSIKKKFATLLQQNI